MWVDRWTLRRRSPRLGEVVALRSACLPHPPATPTLLCTMSSPPVQLPRRGLEHHGQEGGGAPGGDSAVSHLQPEPARLM